MGVHHCPEKMCTMIQIVNKDIVFFVALRVKRYIYTIILLNSVAVSKGAIQVLRNADGVWGVQFFGKKRYEGVRFTLLALRGGGRCLKLFISTDSTSSHEFASQFGLAIFYMRKTHKSYHEDRVPRKCLLNAPVPADRSPPTT